MTSSGKDGACCCCIIVVAATVVVEMGARACGQQAKARSDHLLASFIACCLLLEDDKLLAGLLACLKIKRIATGCCPASLTNDAINICRSMSHSAHQTTWPPFHHQHHERHYENDAVREKKGDEDFLHQGIKM